MLEDGKNEVVSMRSPMRGNVKIGFFFSIVFTVIPYLVQQFKEDHPDSQIEFETEVYHNWADLRELLLRSCHIRGKHWIGVRVCADWQTQDRADRPEEPPSGTKGVCFLVRD